MSTRVHGPTPVPMGGGRATLGQPEVREHQLGALVGFLSTFEWLFNGFLVCGATAPPPPRHGTSLSPRATGTAPSWRPPGVLAARHDHGHDRRPPTAADRTRAPAVCSHHDRQPTEESNTTDHTTRATTDRHTSPHGRHAHKHTASCRVRSPSPRTCAGVALHAHGRDKERGDPGRCGKGRRDTEQWHFPLGAVASMDAISMPFLDVGVSAQRPEPRLNLGNQTCSDRCFPPR